MASFPLRGGRTVDVEVLDHKTRVSCPDLLQVRDLIRQPQQPWFSDGENALLNRSVSREEFPGIGSVYLIVARLNGEPLGTAWYQTLGDMGEVGGCAFVFTHPSYRGLGISNAVMSTLVSHFRERGGLAMYLGTSNPQAQQVYMRVGFRIYNGVVMRQINGESDDRAFDEGFFSDAGAATIRGATWGDLAQLTALYAYPHPWFVKDHGEMVYSHPTFPQKRALSVPVSLLLRAEQASNTLLVMENSRRRLVGAMSVYSSGDSPATFALDFLVAPSYLRQLPELLEKGRDIARRSGATRLEAFVSRLDQGKTTALAELGFGPTLPLKSADDLPAGVNPELWVYQASLT